MAYEDRQPTGIEERTPAPTGQGMEQQTNANRVKHAWREGSPEEVRDEVRRLVEKGVAAVTGAIRGFTSRAEKDQLPQQAGQAVRDLGETAQSVVKSTGEQASNMRGQLQSTTHELGQTARDVGKTATEETRKTTSEVGSEVQRTAQTAGEQMSEAAEMARKTGDALKEGTQGGGGQSKGGSQQS